MLLLQMICDADCLITNFEAKWSGSVFWASRIYQTLSQGKPTPRGLSTSDIMSIRIFTLLVIL